MLQNFVLILMETILIEINNGMYSKLESCTQLSRETDTLALKLTDKQDRIVQHVELLLTFYSTIYSNSWSFCNHCHFV